jgi:hypothetical protein
LLVLAGPTDLDEPAQAVQAAIREPAAQRLARTLRRVDVERPAALGLAQVHWRDILAAALAHQEAISVRGVASQLRRWPTRAEITAARRDKRPSSGSDHPDPTAAEVRI